MCKRLPLLALVGDKGFLKEASIVGVCKRHKRILRVGEDYNLMHTDLAAVVLDMSGLYCPGFDEWEHNFMYAQGEYMTKEELDEVLHRESKQCQDSWEWLIHPSEEELAEYHGLGGDEVAD